jgi:DNA-binding MarR family transcriptional regulator
MDKYDSLKLENQLCFPLYATAKEIVRKYKPFLEEIDLTYTQYITMMVMWEEEEINVTHLGEKLYLDSGTLTPLLKKLEKKGYITRQRSKDDERTLDVKVTEEGLKLRDQALSIPSNISGCIKLSKDEAIILYKTLNKILDELK